MPNHPPVYLNKTSVSADSQDKLVSTMVSACLQAARQADSDRRFRSTVTLWTVGQQYSHTGCCAAVICAFATESEMSLSPR